MVTIKKGNKTRNVSFSVFRNYFQSSGWEVVDKNKLIENEVSNVDESKEEEFSDEIWDSVEAEDKTVEEMNGDELRSYAKTLGLDISGLNSNRKIRDAIKNATR